MVFGVPTSLSQALALSRCLWHPTSLSRGCRGVFELPDFLKSRIGAVALSGVPNFHESGSSITAMSMVPIVIELGLSWVIGPVELGGWDLSSGVEALECRGHLKWDSLSSGVG